MKEIADKAGVSQATVSRVLNGSATVSRDKRARVMEWVRKLDFEPNLTARSLAANRSHLIGVILPDLMNPFFSELLAHIERIASRNGYNVILANTEGDPVREKDEFTSLKARQVDGILAVPAPDSQILQDLREQRIKSVIITLEFPGIDCVGVSHQKGGALVAEHFLEIGVKKFAFFGSEDDVKFKGFRDLLTDAGITNSRIETIGNGSWWLSATEQGFQSALDYLREHQSGEKLGIFAVNDPFALGVVHAAQDLGMSIPDDVAIAGFDDTFLCDHIRPTLTSVAQPMEDIGRLAVELLLKRIEIGFDETVQQHILLEPRLVRRETA